jgi:hypothetical protein
VGSGTDVGTPAQSNTVKNIVQNVWNRIFALNNAKQNNLSRTIGSDDNATGTVNDTGGNLTVPVPVTITAPSSSATQATAGTRSLRALSQIIVNNIANLFATRAPLASPALTGTPTTPTAAQTVNNTQIASTAYVKTAVNEAQLTTQTWLSAPITNNRFK